MNVYADHNFLINCAEKPTWRQAVVEAHQSGRITIVLSAWHFYEYGNASGHPETEDLIQFAEELQPQWILERGDLQHQEFIAFWNCIWGSAPLVFNPVCTLAQAGATLNRVSVERMARYSVREYIQSFSAPGALDEIRAELKNQTSVAKYNLDKYVNDKRFNAVLPLTELMYVAVQMARLREIERDKVYALANLMLREQPLSTQIQCFVYWKCTEYLKAYKTEVAFTLELYATGATLGVNRQIDRQHAIAALPYCDLFITDDADLIKRIARVKRELRFETASVLRGQAFIDTL
jgi:hypothetical protein